MANAASGRFGNCARTLRALTLNVVRSEVSPNGIDALETAKCSQRRLLQSLQQGAIRRSYFFAARSEGSSSPSQEQAKSALGHTGVIKSPVEAAGRANPLNFIRSVGKYADLANLKSWRSLSRLFRNERNSEVEEILRPVRSWRTSLNSPHIDQHRCSLQSSRRNYKHGQKLPSLDAVTKYSVIRINSDGTLHHLELKSSELGLHPRDVDLLSNSTFIPQRATISVQRENVLVRMENVRAIVSKDHVLLFDARHPRDGMTSSQGSFIEKSHHRARDAFAKALSEHAKVALSDPTPFHLRVVESLLEETSTFFHQKVDRLKFVVELMLQELTDDVSVGGLRRLLPLRRAVTELEHDVRDAHEAMDQVVRSDEILQSLCLIHEGEATSSNSQGAQITDEKDEPVYKLRQAAADMLLTYQREVDDAGGVLEELRKGMEAAQEVWELGLDATRNRIIRMNLYISISTLAVAMTTIPAAFFGMNLVSGFEEHPTLFYWVVGAGTLLPVCIWLTFTLAFQLWPRIVDKRRAQDLAGLLDLLRHLDSIDEIIGSVAREGRGKPITPKEFRKILGSQSHAHFMRQREIDLLFRMLDTNRSGVLEEVKDSNIHQS